MSGNRPRRDIACRTHGHILSGLHMALYILQVRTV